MPKIDVIDGSKKVVDTLDLSEDIFAAEAKEAIVHQVVVSQLARRRRGTKSTKTRDEVRGGGAKPWQQKGTGRARAGSIRSPIWRGGGVAFAPKPRDFSFHIPKKMRRTALISALSSLYSEGRIKVVDSIEIDEIKTKKAVEFLKGLELSDSLLLIHTGGCEKLVRSLRNIPNVKTLMAAGLNVYDLLRYEDVVCTRDAVTEIEKRFAK